MINNKLISYLIFTLLSAVIFSCANSKKKKSNDAKTNMESISKIETYTLANSHGNEVEITNFGASVMSIHINDKEGKKGNIVLGYDEAEEYIHGNPYFGAIIGRYANRIADGEFELDGKKYVLNKNNGDNHLHGGPGGFHNVIWKGKKTKADGCESVELRYTSHDMEEGYPGKLNVKVVYSWTENNELIIDYLATSNKKTIINLTHHSFFNLKDGGKSKITSHQLKINADNFLPVDKGLIPTGEFRPVKNTPMDFRKMHAIGDHINHKYKQLKYGNGYDHNYVLYKNGDSLIMAAEIYEPSTGRVMKVYTNQPGLQFYSGNFLDGSDTGHNKNVYNYRTAFCLEAQHFPDSPNHLDFPPTEFMPGEIYKQTTIYKFLTKEE